MRVKWPEFLYPLYDLVMRLGKFVFRPAHPLNRNEGYQPFFIVGSGRCGTTLLRRMLEASPEIHIPPEIWALHGSIPYFRRNRNMPWGHLVRYVLGWVQFQVNFDIPLGPLVDQLLAAPKGSRSLAFILDSLYRYHGEKTGAELVRWGDKTPSNVEIVDEVLAVFPDAKYVHMIRDGVDVVSSMMKIGIKPSLERAARRWKRTVKKARSFSLRHPGICHELRYETLVTEPGPAVEGVCEFLEIGFRVEMVTSLDHVQSMPDLSRDHLRNARRPISTASLGKGRRELTQEQKQHLQRLIGKELQECGYDPAV